MECFNNISNLQSLTFHEIQDQDMATPSILVKNEFVLSSQEIPKKKLMMKFQSVDTEELKDAEIIFDGKTRIFKLGEGDLCHYKIPNDSKLWDTQFMIVSMNGQYYISDLGIVHSTRIKLDLKNEIQIKDGQIIDFGKVGHFHFDKVIHNSVPTAPISSTFYKMNPSNNDYQIDNEDFPHLRARPTWISADENIDNIQNEINIYDSNKKQFSIGRSIKRDIQIKLKAMSADQCMIEYSQEKVWIITENKKARLSSNGTFVYLKTMQQVKDHIPSDLIPIYDDMIISFVNYELKLTLI